MKCIACFKDKELEEFRIRYEKRGQPCKSCYSEWARNYKYEIRLASGLKVYDCENCDRLHCNHGYPKLCRKCQAKDAKIPLKFECK